tara:strand:+ start:3529 stop:3693 length:165 start_codon:yes stop_codon:yes gene_type:complete
MVVFPKREFDHAVVFSDGVIIDVTNNRGYIVIQNFVMNQSASTLEFTFESTLND